MPKHQPETNYAKHRVVVGPASYVVTYRTKKGVWMAEVCELKEKKLINKIEHGLSRPPSIPSSNEIVKQYLFKQNAEK